MSHPIRRSHPAFGNLWDSFREALFAAYLEGKRPPYLVPYHLDGDRFHFKKASTHTEAVKSIESAVSSCIRAALDKLQVQEGAQSDGQ